MSVFIGDSQGSGYEAGVDSEHRLLVSSVMESLFRHKSDLGDAYAVYLRHNSQVIDTDEKLGYLVNNSSNKNIRISKITFTTDATVGKFEAYFAPTYTSGGTARTPLNMNRASAKSSGVVVRGNPNNDLVMSVSADYEFACVRLSVNTFTLDLDDAVLLGPGKSIGLVCAANATGKSMRATVLYYEEDI